MRSPPAWLLPPLLLLAATHAAPSHAQDTDPPAGSGDDGSEDGDEGEGDGEGDAPPPTPPIDLSTGETLEGLTPEDYRFLEPKLGRLPPNPYQQTDFTAYTLEWGEVKLGVASLTVGVLPRTELGTSLTLDLLGLPNGALKVNAVRAGPVDVALLGSYYAMPLETITGSRAALGARASVILAPAWSVHLQGDHALWRAEGIPDFSSLAGPLSWLIGEEIDAYSLQAIEDEYNLTLRAQTTTLGLATDVRFNRRDSLVLQGRATVHSALSSAIDGELPPIFNLDEILNQEQSGAPPLAESYVASIAYQAAWKRAELRLGVGASATPGAWLLQSLEYSYRFGGKTRREERRVYETWRLNKEDVERRR